MNILYKPRGVADVPSQQGDRRPSRGECSPTTVALGGCIRLCLSTEFHLQHSCLELSHPLLVGMSMFRPRVSQLDLQSSHFDLRHSSLVGMDVSLPFVHPLALEDAQSSLLQLVSHLCQTHVMLPLVFGGRNLHHLHLRSLELCRIFARCLGSRRFCIFETRVLLPAKDLFWENGSNCWGQEPALLLKILAGWASVKDGGITQSTWARGRCRRKFDSGAPIR